MQKNAASMIVIALIALSTALPAEAGGRRHHKNNNNVNGWAAAAIGAVVGVAIGSAIANNQSPSYTYTQPNYANQYPPQYYAPRQACVTTQVPVYNQFGQIVQYRQICAN
jgi:hypothetical protein